MLDVLLASTNKSDQTASTEDKTINNGTTEGGVVSTTAKAKVKGQGHKHFFPVSISFSADELNKMCIPNMNIRSYIQFLRTRVAARAETHGRLDSYARTGTNYTYRKNTGMLAWTDVRRNFISSSVLRKVSMIQNKQNHDFEEPKRSRPWGANWPAPSYRGVF